MCLHTYKDGLPQRLPLSQQKKFKRIKNIVAELGNQFAQYRLGKLFLGGDDSIPRDIESALRWLLASAEQGNGYAEYALALVYLKGEDVPKDGVKAFKLLKRSAGRGNQFAQYRLGKLLLKGRNW